MTQKRWYRQHDLLTWWESVEKACWWWADFFFYIILHNYFVSLWSKTSFRTEKSDLEMTEEPSFCNQNLTFTQKASQEFLLSARSLNQLNPAVANLHVAPNKTQLMTIKIQKEWGLNTIRWQTCLLMKNGSLELAWTIDEVHMVFWGLELCSPKSTGHEWWAQLAVLHTFKRLHRHRFNCKQLIFKWIFHTFTGVFHI